LGLRVVVAYTGMEGDTEKNLVLTQVVPWWSASNLVENFGFDDRQLKTLGMGKKSGTSPESGWGAIEILVYSPGTEMPPAKLPQNTTPPKTAAETAGSRISRYRSKTTVAPRRPAKLLRPRMCRNARHWRGRSNQQPS